MKYEEYIDRKVVRETEKAFLVEQEVNNPRDGWRTNFRWVAKKLCRESEQKGYVKVPEWVVCNGVWNR